MNLGNISMKIAIGKESAAICTLLNRAARTLEKADPAAWTEYAQLADKFVQRMDAEIWRVSHERARLHTTKCLDCGLFLDDPRCCQNDEELWK
jgi:hypothetical protein